MERPLLPTNASGGSLWGVSAALAPGRALSALPRQSLGLPCRPRARSKSRQSRSEVVNSERCTRCSNKYNEKKALALALRQREPGAKRQAEPTADQQRRAARRFRLAKQVARKQRWGQPWRSARVLWRELGGAPLFFLGAGVVLPGHGLDEPFGQSTLRQYIFEGSLVQYARDAAALSRRVVLVKRLEAPQLLERLVAVLVGARMQTSALGIPMKYTLLGEHAFAFTKEFRQCHSVACRIIRASCARAGSKHKRTSEKRIGDEPPSKRTLLVATHDDPEAKSHGETWKGRCTLEEFLSAVAGV